MIILNIDITNITGSLSKMGANINNKKGYNLDDKEEFKIVNDTLSRFGIDTSLFINNLKTLIIKSETASHLIDNDSIVSHGSYNPLTNEIMLVDESALIHELFHMASNKLDYTNNLGVLFHKNGREVCKSLNEGITDLFTSMSINGYECKYPLESLFASFLSEIYGNEIFVYHFKQNPSQVYKLFKEDIQKVAMIIVKLDEYTNSFDVNIGLIPQKFIDFCTLYLKFMYEKDENMAISHFERIKNTFTLENENAKKISQIISQKININEVFDKIKDDVFGKAMK